MEQKGRLKIVKKIEAKQKQICSHSRSIVIKPGDCYFLNNILTNAKIVR